MRTTVLATALSALALLAGSVLLLATLDRSLDTTGDTLARGRVHDLAAQAVDGTLPDTRATIDGEGVGQVFGTGGRVLAASPNITGRGPIIDAPPPSSKPVLRIVHDAPDDDQTEDYRLWVQTVPVADGHVTVLAGTSLESVGEASRTLRRALAVGVPVLLLLLTSGTWLGVGRTLRPVEAIREEVTGITDDDLGRRVPVPPTGDEVARLAVTMNEMLDRLEDASRRQRDFVADASHELQSPITALRTQLEVALEHPGDEWPELARRLLSDTDEMERLVRDLLFLARSSDDRLPASTWVDLDDVVLEEVARVRPGTSVVLDTQGVSAAPVTGDADELRRLVRNLLENAVRHARTAVHVRLSADPDGVRLEVADDGPGVDADDRDRIFDRFWTTDGARGRGSGSGLGLAIARQIAMRHGGSLVLAADDPGARFVLVLPAGHDVHRAALTLSE